MKTTALLLAIAVTSTALPAQAAPSSRGFLSVLGVSLVVLGTSSSAIGLSGLLQKGDAEARLAAFADPLPQADAGLYRSQLTRQADGGTLSTVGFIIGGALLAGGVACLVIDGLGSTPAVSFAPTVGGGSLVFSARF